MNADQRSGRRWRTPSFLVLGWASVVSPERPPLGHIATSGCAHPRELARRARNELSLEPLTPDSEEFFRQMMTLRLPDDAPKDLQQRLYDEHRIEIPVFERGEERFIRASFQG